MQNGTLESVSTDHCPFNSEQKALGRDDFSKIPNGLAMIQHRLVKLWDLGVAGGRITPSELVDLTSTTIARRFGLAKKGTIAPGMDADLVVFDPSTPFEFSTRTSHMNVDYDLFEGESSTGSVRHTFCRGTLVYDRGEILHGAGPRPLRAALAGRDGRRRVVMDADRVIADLRELAELTGGAGRRPPRVLDRRVGQGARAGALASSRSCRSRSRPTRPATSGPTSPASRTAS